MVMCLCVFYSPDPCLRVVLGGCRCHKRHHWHWELGTLWGMPYGRLPQHGSNKKKDKRVNWRMVRFFQVHLHNKNNKDKPRKDGMHREFGLWMILCFVFWLERDIWFWGTAKKCILSSKHGSKDLLLWKRASSFLSTEDENLWVHSRLTWFDEPRAPEMSLWKAPKDTVPQSAGSSLERELHPNSLNDCLVQAGFVEIAGMTHCPS